MHAPAGDGAVVFTPQVWDHPALTEANFPPGGVSSLATEPSVFTPAGVRKPSADRGELFSAAWTGQTRCKPQQATEPSVFTPQV